MSVMQDAMLTLLKNSKDHLTADEIFFELRKSYPSASLATVYRNLDMFTREGKIQRVSIGSNSAYYEGNVTPHYHAVCPHCGRVSDFNVDGLPEFLSQNIQGELLSINLTVNYICDACAKQTSEN